MSPGLLLAQNLLVQSTLAVPQTVPVGAHAMSMMALSWAWGISAWGKSSSARKYCRQPSVLPAANSFSEKGCQPMALTPPCWL